MVVAGTVALGIWGPRMNQRMQGPKGHGLSELVDVAIEDHSTLLHESMVRRVEEGPQVEEVERRLKAVLGPTAQVPDFSSLGFGLADARPAGLRRVHAGAGMLLVYLQTDPMRTAPLAVYLLDGSIDWLHFDALGRQVVLSEGSRLDDWIEFAPRSFVAVSVQRLEGVTVLLLGLDAALVEEAADLLGPQEDDKAGIELDSLVFSTPEHSIRRFKRATIDMDVSFAEVPNDTFSSHRPYCTERRSSDA